MNEAQITEAAFVERLLAAVPEAQQVADEHFADYGGLLLHLLMADLLRFSARAFSSGDHETAAKLLEFMSSAFENGDDRVENAVAVSFVENVGALPDETPEFIASWPKSLIEERQRQLDWRPGR